MQLFSRAVPVWNISKDEVSDQYRVFRKKFTVDADCGQVFLDIAADTTFCVMINGVRLPIQQLAGFRGDISVSRHDITPLLDAGENIIACEVHFVGANFFTCFAGTAFLCAEIHDGKNVFAATDETWKCAVSPDMQSGLNCSVSPQLGFVFCKDARKSVPWEQLYFDDSAWQEAVKVDGCEQWKMSLRSVPQLAELPGADEECVHQMGYVLRRKEEETFAATAFKDFLSPCRPDEFLELEGDTPNRVWMKKGTDLVFKPLPEDVDGCFILLDIGREDVGFIDLDITAPDGAVVDICHGEHLEDGRVRSRIGVRNFTDRFICRAGRNRLFCNHRRFGLRYIELHITNCHAGKIILHHAGIIRLELPLPEQAYFTCGDRMIQKLNALSYHTLKLCMHEHYEDCPWREQALYAYDSRNQMLYGYHVWGNYDFAAVSLDLLGKSFDGKDYIDLIAPGESGLTIPIFTMVWITALYEHMLYSGDDVLVRKYLPQVDTIINSAFERDIDGVPGLYHTGSGSRIWNFCEWNGRLSQVKGHPQAPFNIYLYEAINSAAKIHAMLGNTVRQKELVSRAEELGEAVEKFFYNSSKKFYAAGYGSKEKEEKAAFEMNSDLNGAVCELFEEGYEHIQQIMLANELVPEEKRENILENIMSGKLRRIDLSAFRYLIAGMMKSGAEARRYLASFLVDSFEGMVFEGATSLWETGKVFDSFGGGSLCHAWSSVMPYFCAHCILGVTPLEPGFRKFEVKPYPAGLPEASGSIPTPSGFIHVSWKKTPDGMTVQVRHPENLKCVTGVYPECGNVKFDISCGAVSSCAQKLIHPAALK